LIHVDVRLFETLKKSEVLSVPILKRLNVGVALVAIELLHDLRNMELPEEEEETPQGMIKSYNKNRQMMECYSRLIQFLLSDALQLSEKTEQIIIDIIVECTSLEFLCELAGGYYDSTLKEIRKFDADQAVALLDQKLNVSPDQIVSLGGTRSSDPLVSAFYLRRTHVILDNVVVAMYQYW
jgi:hypothetical protein